MVKAAKFFVGKSNRQYCYFESLISGYQAKYIRSYLGKQNALDEIYRTVERELEILRKHKHPDPTPQQARELWNSLQ